MELIALKLFATIALQLDAFIDYLDALPTPTMPYRGGGGAPSLFIPTRTQ